MSQTWHKWQFNRHQQRIFLEDLNALVSEGVAPSQAIAVLSETNRGIRQHIAKAIDSGLSQGQSLADSMRNWFNTVVIEMIFAGESSGTLTASLQAAVESLQAQQNLWQDIIHALAYPLTVFILALTLLVFIKNSVLDTFLKIKPFDQWPSNGISLMHFAQVIQDWWWLFSLILIGGIFFIIRLLRDLTGDVRAIFDNLPLISLYRDACAARFMQTLGRMLSNGVLMKKAIVILLQDANPYLHSHLMLMEFNLSGGNENIADVLDTQLIRPDELLRLKVIARTRGFANALLSLGKQATERVEKRLRLLNRFVSTLLMLASALIAATTIFAIYSIGSTLAS